MVSSKAELISYTANRLRPDLHSSGPNLRPVRITLPLVRVEEVFIFRVRLCEEALACDALGHFFLLIVTIRLATVMAYSALHRTGEGWGRGGAGRGGASPREFQEVLLRSTVRCACNGFSRMLVTNLRVRLAMDYWILTDLRVCIRFD